MRRPARSPVSSPSRSRAWAGRSLRRREYFQIVYDIVRKHGGLCIADEVQTGFGRTGTAFWGFENWGVTPDLVTMAKGIGNGVPWVRASRGPRSPAS